MLTHLSKFDNYCQPKQLQLNEIEMFRHKFVHQIMLQTLNYSNTTRNESNIILKLMRHQWLSGSGRVKSDTLCKNYENGVLKK